MGALEELRRDLQAAADPKKALVMQRFFKTGRGHYGEGDVFIGLTVPRSRLITKKYSGLPLLQDIQNLPHCEVHGERLVALLILVQRFRQDPGGIAKFYLDNLAWVNNRDLVDPIAPCILGACLEGKDRSPLYRLVKPDMLWERRVAVVAKLHFIRRGDFSDTLKIAGLLLYDKHDLMHKATGWMLREVGKRDAKAEEAFLAKHCREVPRTMLRYAVERFPEQKRRTWKAGRLRPDYLPTLPEPTLFPSRNDRIIHADFSCCCISCIRKSLVPISWNSSSLASTPSRRNLIVAS